MSLAIAVPCAGVKAVAGLAGLVVDRVCVAYCGGSISPNSTNTIDPGRQALSVGALHRYR